MRWVLRVSFVAFFSVSLIVPASTFAAGRRRSVRSNPGAGSTESPVTTFGKIDREVAEGRMSPEQGMVYKVFATFDDPRLPASLRGDDTAVKDTLFMTDVNAAFGTLPEAMQEQVAPYLIPPFHENSWWDLRRKAAAKTYAPLWTRPCPSFKCSLSFSWKFVATNNGKVKVWYVDGEDADAAKARAFAEAIDNVIWPALKALMGREPLPDEGVDEFGSALGGDERLDIALLDLRTSITTATYPDDCDGAAWTFIQFKKSEGVEELAHELMHAFQYAFRFHVRDSGCTGDGEYRWLMEATAEWVKDYIFPASNSEHWAAAHYLDQPERPLNFYTSDSAGHAYGAYLLPFFLTRVKGQTVVYHIWSNVERAASLEAVDQALSGGFKEVWPEFVFHNWNDDPVDEYDRIDQLKAHPKETGTTFLGDQDAYAALNIQLPHLAATYKHFVFNDRPRSVAFVNGLTFKVASTPRSIGALDLGLQYTWENVPEDQKKGAAVWAIVKIGGKWEEPADWSGIPYKTFCRQKPEERIEELVLIFSNSNISPDAVVVPPGESPFLVTTDMGCSWEGTLTWEASPLAEMMMGALKVTYHLTFEPFDPMLTKDFFLGYAYKTSGYASWSVSGAFGDCSYRGGSESTSIRTDLQTLSFNFAPEGSLRYRKAHFIIGLPEPLEYQLVCPQGSQELNAGIYGYGFPFPDPLMVLDVTSSGIKGDSGDEMGIWRWDFKPKE